jgi:hypothetical protein
MMERFLSCVNPRFNGDISRGYCDMALVLNSALRDVVYSFCCRQCEIVNVMAIARNIKARRSQAATAWRCDP